MLRVLRHKCVFVCGHDRVRLLTVVTHGQASNPRPRQWGDATPRTRNSPPARFIRADRMDTATLGVMTL